MANAILIEKLAAATESSTDTWADLSGFSQAVSVASTNSVLILCASVAVTHGVDLCAKFQFAVDTTREGPVGYAQADNDSDGEYDSLHSLMHIIDGGLSGTTTFSLMWQSVGSLHLTRNSTLESGFQVIEIIN